MDKNKLAEILGYGRDFAQGASNGIASNVSAPVDLFAVALRKAGVPVPDDPVMGTRWMFDHGLTPVPQNQMAGLLGESVGNAGSVVAMSKVPQAIAEFLRRKNAGLLQD